MSRLLLVFAVVLLFASVQPIEAQTLTCDGTVQYLLILPSTSGWTNYAYTTGTDATGAYIQTNNAARRLQFNTPVNYENIQQIYVLTNNASNVDYLHVRITAGMAFAARSNQFTSPLFDPLTIATTTTIQIYRDTSLGDWRLYQLRLYCSNYPPATATPTPSPTWTPVVIYQPVTATPTTNPGYTNTPTWTPVVIYQPVTATPTTNPGYTNTPTWTPVVIYQPVTATPTTDPMHTPTPSWTPVIEYITTTPLPTYTPWYQLITNTPEPPTAVPPTQTPWYQVVTATASNIPGTTATPTASRTPFTPGEIDFIAPAAEMKTSIDSTFAGLMSVFAFFLAMGAIRLGVRFARSLWS